MSDEKQLAQIKGLLVALVFVVAVGVVVLTIKFSIGDSSSITSTKPAAVWVDNMPIVEDESRAIERFPYNAKAFIAEQRRDVGLPPTSDSPQKRDRWGFPTR